MKKASDNDGSQGNQISPEVKAAWKNRQSDSQGSSFEERAAANASKVSGIHEFRRGNIREYEPDDRDFFDYDPTEQSRKYDGLKAETIFRFDQTYKAIQWGIAVGAMFAAHRYYRSRSLDGAAYWFATASMFSATNIWVSNGMHSAATEMGSK